jgi:sRNA-binding protein
VAAPVQPVVRVAAPVVHAPRAHRGPSRHARRAAERRAAAAERRRALQAAHQKPATTRHAKPAPTRAPKPAAPPTPAPITAQPATTAAPGGGGLSIGTDLTLPLLLLTGACAFALATRATMRSLRQG